ncbi:MAG: glycosyltransferase [Gammaproteobacteria bacterium]|nr:MAG: glycosyltransferase [Gammaproteobacteria bacterium]
MLLSETPPDTAVGTPAARLATLSVAQRLLAAIFVAVGIWYLAWRPSSFNPSAPAFSALIYGAELFGFGCALLYLFMCWQLRVRRPRPPPSSARVAVFVPTINESVDIVRRTLMSARALRYATEVWLLDDGNRPEMRVLADELGCRYLARSVNTDAKAGNLNHALQHSDAEFVALFDADHAPMPAFLEETLGFFADPRVAFVQTPQDFYNLDSFQHRHGRNNSLVWSEQSLFFRVIQAGKDRLNSAFFCGSCAVVRRKALDDIGGFATGTVTEDIHTSLRLHKRGWRSVYYARSLAFGLAPASAVPFLKQRLRWGQGAMQVWRRERVLTATGLSLSQRLSYLATMLAYFEGWQRAVFFLAPVVVLTTGTMPILAFDDEFLVRFVPYYLLTFWVFEEVARGYGRTLLTEQYTMIRFAVFVTATFGWFLRELRFVVTPKTAGQATTTRRYLWPQYLVLALNAIAIPVGLLLHWRGGGLPTGALLANLLWASLTLGLAALAIRFALRVASFQRREYRFPLSVPFRIAAPGRPGLVLATDLSPLGCRLIGTAAGTLGLDTRLRGELLLPTGPVPVEASVRSRQFGASPDAADAAGCEFHWASAGDCHRLEQFLFGSDLQWHLNGYSERARPPLERLADLLHGGDGSRLPAGQRWSPLLLAEEDGANGAAVGFISAPQGAVGARAVVTLGSLPAGMLLRAREITATGVRRVTGRVAARQRVETHSAPFYVYRLST